MNLCLICSLLLRLIAYVAGFDYPNFHMRVGQTLDTNVASFFKSVPILSNCRQLCSEDAQCIAFVSEPFSYRWKCFLFKYGLTYQVLNETCTTVQFGVKIVPGSTLAVDSLYYYINKIRLNATDAKASCLSGLGYRLALTKTKVSLQVTIAAFQAGFTPLVDLWKNGTNLPVFGDGTPYQDTEVGRNTPPLVLVQNNGPNASVFSIWDDNLDDDIPYHTYYNALCQGNPLMI